MIYRLITYDRPFATYDLPICHLWSTYPSHSAEIGILEKKVDHRMAPPKGQKAEKWERGGGATRFATYDLPTPWNLQKERFFLKTDSLLMIYLSLPPPKTKTGRS